MKKIFMMVALLPLLACSDSTGTDADLNGTWRFTYTNLAGSYIGLNVQCTLGDVEFALTQSGDTFSGTQVGSEQLTCTAGGTTVADTELANFTIVNGQISGNSVTFQFGTVPGQNNATLSGDSSMSGTTQLLITGGGTAQIQKNIISERGLGMPREPKAVEA